MKTKRSGNTSRSGSHDNDPVRGKLDPLIQMFRQGKRRAAREALVVLAREYPESAPVAGYLAGVYYQMHDLKKAAEYFRRTTKLSPKSELASLGLFHSLWGQGLKHEAVDEMRRFLSLTDSAEYAQLLHDFTVEGKLVPSMEAAKVA